MGGWAAQAPAILSALAILVLPGLPAALCLRARGVLRLGAAIVLSLAIVAVASFAAPLLGLRWSPLPIAIVAAVVTMIAALLRWLGRMDTREVPERTGWGTWASLGIAFLGWVAILLVGINGVDHPSQLYDGLFHLNAVEFISQTGDASPLHMTMIVPGEATAFYPTLWHAVVSLVVPVSGTVVAATNVVTIAVVALIWPVALACVTTVVFPTRPSAAAWAPLVAFGFSVFPLGFLNWGVLYPNLIGTALVPLFLTAVVRAFHRGESWTQHTLWIFVALAAAGATGVGHPSALLAGIALTTPFLIWRAWMAWRTAGRAGRIILGTAVLIGLVALAVIWLRANVTTNEWLPTQTMAQAFGEVAFLSPVARTAGFLLGPLAAIGVWRVVKDRSWWILVSYAVSIGFFIAAAWLPILPLRSAIVGVWYDDTTRVGALIALWGLPLAALGASVVVEWLRRQWREGPRRRAAAIAVVLVLGAASHLPMLRSDISYMRNASFLFTPQSQGLSSDEAALFAEIDSVLDEDSVVLGDPLTGAGLLYAYTGHSVVFPHVTGRYGDDAALLAREFAGGGVEICEAASRLGVTHAIDFGDLEIFPNHWTTFDGLHGLSASPILEEVDRVGDAVLYELTGCE